MSAVISLSKHHSSRDILPTGHQSKSMSPISMGSQVCSVSAGYTELTQVIDLFIALLISGIYIYMYSYSVIYRVN
jgi:hypothetical protein